MRVTLKAKEYHILLCDLLSSGHYILNYYTFSFVERNRLLLKMLKIWLVLYIKVFA